MENSKKKLFVVTGGAGFIGSNLVKKLNKEGFENIIIVDHLQNNGKKEQNLKKLKFRSYFERDVFLDLVRRNDPQLVSIEAIIHLGAHTDTTDTNKKFLIENNTTYSQKLFNFCLKNDSRFIYASSAATYGDGRHGYTDKERNLQPLNFYGYSKYLFDEWLLNRKIKPKQWVGLKFFNVYGPNEDHKGTMASVVYHGFWEIVKDGEIKLFKSYQEDIKHGKQKRDFIYVKDVIKVILFFLKSEDKNGIFNVGTGNARTYLDLAVAVFNTLDRQPKIKFIEMPEAMRNRYQYFTEADISSLRRIGYKQKFYDLEEGIRDYIKNYLIQLK